MEILQVTDISVFKIGTSITWGSRLHSHTGVIKDIEYDDSKHLYIVSLTSGSKIGMKITK